MSDDEIDDGLDVDDLGLDDDDTFDDFDDGSASSLGGGQDNPLVKIGIIAAVVVGVFGIIMFLGSGEKSDPNVSRLPAGSSVNQPPGTAELTPAMREQINIRNEDALEQAQLTGEAFIPTPVDTPSDALKIQQDSDDSDDPLRRWRELQEQRLTDELAIVQPVAQGNAGQEINNADVIQKLADLMSEQMSAILESRTAVQVKNINITSPAFLDALEEEKKKETIEFAAAQAQTQEPIEATEVLLAAGEIAYSQLLIEANTDIPGPVLAQIVAGPLRGSRVIGSFQQNYDTLTLNFDTIILDGVAVSMSGIAVDPNTSLTGMATEVDRRYFKRVLLPMAASFIEGVSEAVAESGNTTITIQGESVAEETAGKSTNQEVASGIDEAGAELSDILDDMQEETKVLIRIEAGTPFGLLLLDSVIVGEDGSLVSQPQQVEPASGGSGNQGTLPDITELTSGL